MKLLQASHIFFYLCSIILSFNCNLQALPSDASLLLDIYTSQMIIKNMHDDIDHWHTIHNEDEKDYIVEILIVLSHAYEKLVGATVLYCLMMHDPLQQKDIYNEITKIVVDTTKEILSILRKKLIVFIFDTNISLHTKIGACVVIISMIVIIKLAIDQIPLSMNVEKNQELLGGFAEKSSYVSDKFNNYR